MTASCASNKRPQQQQQRLEHPRSSGQKHPLSGVKCHRKRSCLRATSAFGGPTGSRLDELSTTRMISVSFGAEPKKSLSFADQRGRQLVLEREFCPLDAPVHYCDVPMDVTASRRSRRRSSSSMDRWLEEALARQHVLSVWLVSCSLLGCALLGLRQTAK